VRRFNGLIKDDQLEGGFVRPARAQLTIISA
jgi:hypothetical protein